MSPSKDPIRIAFVCVQNAGRSQMAVAFAERAVADRGLEDEVELLTGGTNPAHQIHDAVIVAMDAKGFDLRDRVPREITFEEVRNSDLVITMGCSAEDVCPAGWVGDHRDWNLEDPHGKSVERVGKIRNEIETRVRALFDELEMAPRDG